VCTQHCCYYPPPCVRGQRGAGSRDLPPVDNLLSGADVLARGPVMRQVRVTVLWPYELHPPLSSGPHAPQFVCILLMHQGEAHINAAVLPLIATTVACMPLLTPQPNSPITKIIRRGR
jgi:hypothetical protein